jgi:hypothetical protein
MQSNNASGLIGRWGPLRSAGSAAKTDLRAGAAILCSRITEFHVAPCRHAAFFDLPVMHRIMR